MVLGHVDAGKSTLMGRLLADLGLVPARTLHRHAHDAAAAGKASFSWAWVLDERFAGADSRCGTAHHALA